MGLNFAVQSVAMTDQIFKQETMNEEEKDVTESLSAAENAGEQCQDSNTGSDVGSGDDGCNGTQAMAGDAGEPDAEARDVTVEPIGEMFTANEVEARVAEAERQGYLRGRNESIEELMKRPAMLERDAVFRPDGTAPDDKQQPPILKRQRISIWDR